MGGAVQYFIQRKPQLLTKSESLTHHPYLYRINYYNNLNTSDWIPLRVLRDLYNINDTLLNTILYIDIEYD